MARPEDYRAFQSETVEQCSEKVSAQIKYEARHRQTFGCPPPFDWLTTWNHDVRRQALLRIPIIWC